MEMLLMLIIAAKKCRFNIFYTDLNVLSCSGLQHLCILLAPFESDLGARDPHIYFNLAAPHTRQSARGNSAAVQNPLTVD